MKKVLKIFLHLIFAAFLTALTQVGGLIYLISLFFFRKNLKRPRLKRALAFSTIYLCTTFLIIPFVAPVFGREKIADSKYIEAHTFFTKLTNRNYVKPELQIALKDIAVRLSSKYKGIKISYLDANFPFMDGFKLVPHLSHNDGKKIDISLVYETKSGLVVNEKQSRSGYGAYEDPRKDDIDHTFRCKKQGYWQYDFPKYLSFGKINTDLKFSNSGTKQLVLEIVKQKNVSMVLIEPHLKTRLNLNSRKVRFHGCRAVRHDDHIHFQIK